MVGQHVSVLVDEVRERCPGLSSTIEIQGELLEIVGVTYEIRRDF